MKPREWELFWSGLSLHWSVRESPIGQYSDDQYIKVVDYAAYDALAEENRKLRAALELIAGPSNFKRDIAQAALAAAEEDKSRT